MEWTKDSEDGPSVNTTLNFDKGRVLRVPRHEGMSGSGVKPHSLLNLGTRWGEWSNARSGRFATGEKAPPVPTE
jgi:hypothetical protein